MSADECWESHMAELDAFPDQEVAFLGTWQDGAMAFARVRITGTFENEIRFSGTVLEPTGEQFETTGVYIARVEDGQITGLATYSERWKIFQQLGVLDLG